MMKFFKPQPESTINSNREIKAWHKPTSMGHVHYIGQVDEFGRNYGLGISASSYGYGEIKIGYWNSENKVVGKYICVTKTGIHTRNNS